MHIRDQGMRPKTAAPCKTRSSDPYQGWRVTEIVSGSEAWRGMATAAVAQQRAGYGQQRNIIRSSAPPFTWAHKKGGASQFTLRPLLFTSPTTLLSHLRSSACSPEKVHPIHPATVASVAARFVFGVVGAAAKKRVASPRNEAGRGITH